MKLFSSSAAAAAAAAAEGRRRRVEDPKRKINQSLCCSFCEKFSQGKRREGSSFFCLPLLPLFKSEIPKKRDSLPFHKKRRTENLISIQISRLVNRGLRCFKGIGLKKKSRPICVGIRLNRTFFPVVPLPAGTTRPGR